MSPPTDKLIAILGPTGTGKSALAVHLSGKLNGEIINADAMQMYRGLPITTNKLSGEEREGVPHHLHDFIGLEEPSWTVGDFVTNCGRVVDGLQGRGKVPIVVGGTGYYTLHLLVRGGLVVGGVRDREDERGGKGKWPILDAPTEQIYEKLREVDPVMARRWHPRDRRHVQRSLEIWLRSGRRASEVYSEQRSNVTLSAEEDRDGEVQSGLKYDCLVFWLDAEDDVLRRRLDRRVDAMLSAGLVEEALSMAELEAELRSKGVDVDKSKGIWVSIGYKELEPYIKALREGTLDEKALLRLEEEGVEAVKASTRQYAKTQRRWIRNKLCTALAEAGGGDRLFLLDCTDLEQWQSITQQSQNIAEAFLQGEALPCPSELSQLAKKTLLSNGQAPSKRDFATRKCEVCDRIMMSEDEWERHLKSRSHHKVLRSQRKRAENGARRSATIERVGNSPGID